MDADHVTVWSRGGATDKKNYQMLCFKTHNRAKGESVNILLLLLQKSLKRILVFFGIPDHIENDEKKFHGELSKKDQDTREGQRVCFSTHQLFL